MNTPPPGLDPEVLRSELFTGWRFPADRLQYAPLGFGSHHWIAARGPDRRFVTVDDLRLPRLGGDDGAAFERLRDSFAAAAALHARGLEFVVAPHPDRDGAPLRRLPPHFALAVYPLVEGRAGSWGDAADESVRQAALALLGRLHGVPPSAAPTLRREDFRLECRGELEAALGELDREWAGGPYAEGVRALLRELAPDLRRALTRYDAVAAGLDRSGWVVTHGEPHGGNFIWTAGGPRLVDWDTVLVAPAARDLWHVLPAGEPDGDPALQFYRLAWDLRDVAAYVAEFRGPHVESADTAKAFGGLVFYAGARGRWL